MIAICISEIFQTHFNSVKVQDGELMNRKTNAYPGLLTEAIVAMEPSVCRFCKVPSPGETAPTAENNLPRHGLRNRQSPRRASITNGKKKYPKKPKPDKEDVIKSPNQSDERFTNVPDGTLSCNVIRPGAPRKGACAERVMEYVVNQTLGAGNSTL